MNDIIIDKQIVQGYSKVLLIDFNKVSYTRIWKSELKEFLKKQELQTDLYKIAYDNSKKYQWDSPSYITNSIIEISEENKLIEIANSLFKNVEALLCKHFVFRFTSYFSIDQLTNFFKLANQYNIHSIIALFDYTDAYHSDEFGDLTSICHSLKTIIVFESPFDKNYGDIIYFFTKKYSVKFDKKISEFKIHHELYAESFLHNTYFNRKLFIDRFGEIKNAPEDTNVYGKIEEIIDFEKMKAIISKPEFQKYWHINKDIIDVCKDCEFRYLCVDNRIPLSRNENNWYHQEECNYNPYINKWKGEKGFQTLHECGIISDQNGFSIDHAKLTKINDSLLITEERTNK